MKDNIAIIGTGNLGMAMAKGISEAGLLEQPVKFVLVIRIAAFPLCFPLVECKSGLIYDLNVGVLPCLDRGRFHLLLGRTSHGKLRGCISIN